MLLWNLFIKILLFQYEFYKEFSSNTINILKELDTFLKDR